MEIANIVVDIGNVSSEDVRPTCANYLYFVTSPTAGIGISAYPCERMEEDMNVSQRRCQCDS